MLQWERKTLVISEVRREEEEFYKIKAVSQSQQGKWTTWEAVIDRTIMWADFLEVAPSKVKFPDQVYVWYPAKPPEATVASAGMAQKSTANSVATRVPVYSTSSLADRTDPGPLRVAPRPESCES